MIQTQSYIAVICFVGTLLISTIAFIKIYKRKISNIKKQIFRESINYHFTRQCNYACKFCFHTAKTSFVLDEESAKKGLKMLQESGMKKINFSGGEPFTKPVFLGNLVQYCKEQLKLESVTIVSNGSLISEEWFQKFGKWLDIIAISCDSFDEQALADIGRRANKKVHIEQMYKIRDWCYKYDVLFKINTVVTSRQYNEDMSKYIQELKPYRWKVFQCLLIDGENVGENALRNAEQMVVSKQQFDQFILRHKANNPVPENNEDMKDSYLILDEYMRFLNCQNGKKEPSLSILDVGVEAALGKSGFDQEAFFRRGGKYVWSKQVNELEW